MDRCQGSGYIASERPVLTPGLDSEAICVRGKRPKEFDWRIPRSSGPGLQLGYLSLLVGGVCVWSEYYDLMLAYGVMSE